MEDQRFHSDRPIGVFDSSPAPSDYAPTWRRGGYHIGECRSPALSGGEVVQRAPDDKAAVWRALVSSLEPELIPCNKTPSLGLTKSRNLLSREE